MKILMKSLSAGPEGVRSPGKIYEVPDNEAKGLLEGGYAVAAPEPAAQAPKPEEKAPEIVAAEKVLADAKEALEKASNKQEKAAAGKAVSEAKAALKALQKPSAQA